MTKNNIPFLVIFILFVLTLVSYATYAYFVMGNLTVTNALNVNLLTDRNNMVFVTRSGSLDINVNSTLMQKDYANNGTVASNSSNLYIDFTPNSNSLVSCTYDIVFEWTSSDKYQSHSSGVTTNEFTIEAVGSAECLSGNNCSVYYSEGENYIKQEKDLTEIVGNNTSATVVKGANIASSGSETVVAKWTISSKIYNVTVNQDNISGSYKSRFKVTNVVCSGSSAADFIAEFAPKSGTDAVTSSPWILTSDHTNEWRYAGKNPNNYVSFNGELWRIIGVMPNMTYCTGKYGSDTECNTTDTGSLVKIVRNDSLGTFMLDYKKTGVGSSISNYGSNDWSDSQLMIMLNGKKYLNMGYDVNGKKLHQSYSITNDIVSGNGYNYYNATYSYLDGNGTSIYKPSVASTSNDYVSTSATIAKKIDSSALSKIATVKWDLYGTNSGTNSTPSQFYNIERNIDNAGAVCTNSSLVERRPIYWYGKIGLIYPSDYGYATNGDNQTSGTSSRDGCLIKSIGAWKDTSICYTNDWLNYTGVTSSIDGANYSYQWTITPTVTSGANMHEINASGSSYTITTSSAYSTHSIVHPTLYLKPNIKITGGSGTWNDPYTIN